MYHRLPARAEDPSDDDDGAEGDGDEGLRRPERAPQPVGDLLARHVEVRHHRLPDELVLEIVLVHLCAVACDCRDTAPAGFGKEGTNTDYPFILGS